MRCTGTSLPVHCVTKSGPKSDLGPTRQSGKLLVLRDKRLSLGRRGEKDKGIGGVRGSPLTVIMGLVESDSAYHAETRKYWAQ